MQTQPNSVMKSSVTASDDVSQQLNTTNHFPPTNLECLSVRPNAYLSKVLRIGHIRDNDIAFSGLIGALQRPVKFDEESHIFSLNPK